MEGFRDFLLRFYPTSARAKSKASNAIERYAHFTSNRASIDLSRCVPPNELPRPPGPHHNCSCGHDPAKVPLDESHLDVECTRECIGWQPKTKHDESLCRRCKEINLRHLIICGVRKGKRHLGSLRELMECERCPLCRLVSEAYTRTLQSLGFQEPIASLKGECVLNHFSLDENNYASFLVFELWDLPEEFEKKYKKMVFDCNVIVQLRLTDGRDLAFSKQRLEDFSEEPMSLNIDLRDQVRLTIGRDFISTPTIGRTIDWDLVRAWLEKCEIHSPNFRVCDMTSFPSSLRFVDIERRCLINRDQRDGPYAALSYVWGTDEQKMEMRLRNLRSLETEGGLDPKELSPVIRDAIHVCSRLNLKYLWVDCLCIVQDDPVNKWEQIKAMNLIYSGAYVTLVAAAGLSVDDGLPGTEMTPRNSQPFIDVQGIQLVPMYPDQSRVITKSAWDTRGWTFEEGILSNRCLVFTPYQVSFSCVETCDFWEDHTTKSTLDSFGICEVDYQTRTAFNYKSNQSLASSFDTYVKLIQKYTIRKLSKQSDMINAITGIFNSVYGPTWPDRFLYGMPIEWFEDALQWQPNEPYKLQGFMPPPSSPMILDPEIVLPSWSWISRATGGVDYGLWASEESIRRTPIVWAIYKEGSFHQFRSSISQPATPTLLLPTLEELHRDFNFSRHFPEGTLLFRSTYAHFGLCPYSNFHRIWYLSPMIVVISLTDKNGKHAGIMYKESSWVSTNRRRIDEGHRFKCILISPCAVPNRWARFDNLDHDYSIAISAEMRDLLWRFRREENLTFRDRWHSMINILVVEESDDGIATRVGAGKIFRTEWEKSMPQEGTFLLR